MARPKEVVDAALVRRAEEELARTPDHRVALRLQAIVSCGAHPIVTVASVLGTTRQTVWRWIRRFHRDGRAGLIDRPRGHNPSKLSAAQRQEVARWLEAGTDRRGEPIHWTLDQLAEAIREAWGIRLTRTPIWLLARRLGFRQKVPRPAHAKADPEAQADFKKNRGGRR